MCNSCVCVCVCICKNARQREDLRSAETRKVFPLGKGPLVLGLGTAFGISRMVDDEDTLTFVRVLNAKKLPKR